MTSENTAVTEASAEPTMRRQRKARERDIKNGVARPLNPESKTGRVWSIADSLLAARVKDGEPPRAPTYTEILAASSPVQINIHTVLTQLAYWRKHNGLMCEHRGRQRKVQDIKPFPYDEI